MNAISGAPRSDLAPSEQLRVMLAMPGDKISMNHDFARALLAENAGIRDWARRRHADALAEAETMLDGAQRMAFRARRDLAMQMVIATVSIAIVVATAWLAGWFG